MAKRTREIARTATQAKQQGHRKVRNLSLATMAIADRRAGTLFVKGGAQPGDIAWIGPCVGGNRIVCYYDANMDPSDCRNQPC